MPRRRSPDQLSRFGRSIEGWRRHNGLTQRDLAELCGTRQRTLSNWLKADGLPAAVVSVARLAAIVGQPLEELLGLEHDIGPFYSDKSDSPQTKEAPHDTERALAYLALLGRADHPTAVDDPVHALSQLAVDYRCAAAGYRRLCQDLRDAPPRMPERGRSA